MPSTLPIITRQMYIDDSGLGLDGTIINQSTHQEFQDNIDALIQEVVSSINGGVFQSLTATRYRSTATGSQNDYDWDALAIAGGNLGTTHCQWNGASSCTLTGMSGGVEGRLRIIHNITAAQTLTLVHQSGSSLSTNRFSTATTANLIVAPGQLAMAIYDTTSTRWWVTTFGESTTGFSYNSRSVTTVYQAEADGLLTVFADGTVSGGGVGYHQAFTDSANPPTTQRGGGYTVNQFMTTTIPVKRGDYYKVTTSAISGAAVTYTINWVPIR